MNDSYHVTLRALTISICNSTGSVVFAEPIAVASAADQGSDLIKPELNAVPSLAIAEEPVPAPTFEQQYNSLVSKAQEALSSLQELFTKNAALSQDELAYLKGCFTQNLADCNALFCLLKEGVPPKGEKTALGRLGGTERLVECLSSFQKTRDGILTSLLKGFPQSAVTLNEIFKQHLEASNRFNFSDIEKHIKDKARAIQNVDEAIGYCSFMAQFFQGFGYRVNVKDHNSIYKLLHPRLDAWYRFSFSQDLARHFFVEETKTLQELEHQVGCHESKLLQNHYAQLRCQLDAERKEQLEAEAKELEEQLKVAQLKAKNYLATFPVSKIKEAIEALKALNTSIDALSTEYGEAGRDYDLSLDRDFEIRINDKFSPDGPESDIRKAISKLEALNRVHDRLSRRL